MTMKYYILAILFLSIFTVQSQPTLCNERENIYEHVKTIPFQLDAKAATEALTQPFDDDACKLYAIYLWITEHIAYDYQTFNKSKGKSKTISIKCKTAEECETKWTAFRDKQRAKTLKKRKGVCDDYAHLFQYMAKQIGISSQVIAGFTKNKPGQIGQMGTSDHAWNLIELEGKNYMIDVTYASGYTTTDTKGRLNSFVKKRDDYYFMATPERFLRTHFPSDKKMQETLQVDRATYQNAAYVHVSLLNELEIITPNTGVLNPKVGDTVKFHIKTKQTFEQITIATSLRRQFEVKSSEQIKDPLNEIPLERNEDVYSFYVVITDPNTRFIDILFDRKLAVKFLVRLTK
jgi:hypothetical protein